MSVGLELRVRETQQAALRVKPIQRKQVLLETTKSFQNINKSLSPEEYPIDLKSIIFINASSVEALNSDVVKIDSNYNLITMDSSGNIKNILNTNNE